MADAPSPLNPIQSFVDAKNPLDAIKILQASGLNKDQLYELRRNLNLDKFAPNDFLFANNAWAAAEALKKMQPDDFRKFKTQFGRRYKEATKIGAGSNQTVEKNLGSALGTALGFAPKKDIKRDSTSKRDEEIKRSRDKEIKRPAQALPETKAQTEPTRVEEPEEVMPTQPPARASGGEPQMSAPMQAQKTPTLKGLGQEQTELDRLEGDFNGLQQQLGKLTENVGSMDEKSATKTITTLDQADKVRRQHFEVGSKLIENLPQGNQSAEIAENILSRQDKLNNYVGATSRQLDMSDNPVLKNFDGTRYALGEKDLGKIQATTKKRFELGGMQGPMLQAAITSRLTESARLGEANEGGVAFVRQNISLTKKNLTSVTENRNAASELINSAESKLDTVQKNLQYRRREQAAKGLVIPGSESDRRSKREDFAPQQPIVSQIPDASEIDRGKEELPQTEGDASASAPTPTVRKMPPARASGWQPPGTPANLKPGATLSIERLMSLGAQQYKARRGAQPADQRAQVMGEKSPGESSPIFSDTPGMDQAAYATPPEMEIEGKSGGGEAMSDLGALQQMKRNALMAKRSQKLALGEETGIPGMEEEYEESMMEEGEPVSEFEWTGEEGEEETEEMQEEDLTTRIRFENFAARVMQSQAQIARAKKERATGAVQAQPSGSKAKEQAMQNSWRVFNGASGLSMWGIFLFFISANLQMINTHTFQAKWIPKTEPLEDFAYLLMDMTLALAIFLVCVIFMETITVIAGYMQGIFQGLI